MIAKFESGASQIHDSTPQGSLPRMEFGRRFADQGTVCDWRLGPFVLAHFRAYNNPTRAASFFEPFANHVHSYGPGFGEVLRARTATAGAATGHTKTLTHGAAERVDRLGRAGA